MYSDNREIDRFIQSKIDKFEFSKENTPPEDTSLLWIYNNHIKIYKENIAAWRNIGIWDKDYINFEGIRKTELEEQLRKL